MTDDIIDRLLPFIHDEMRMPAGMIKDVIEEIERLRELVDEYKKLYLLRSRLGDAVGGESWVTTSLST